MIMSDDNRELRDLFAAAVLSGIYANPNHQYNAIWADAREAYQMADAMLKVREEE
jgi:hypothetical protein